MSTTVTLAERLAAWRYAFRTTNPRQRGVVDGVTRWLVVTRAGVLPMTMTSGVIAVLLEKRRAGGLLILGLLVWAIWSAVR